MSLALLFHYLMLNMFRMLIQSGSNMTGTDIICLHTNKSRSYLNHLVYPSSGACDLFVDLFHVLYCSGSMCVVVMLWLGFGGVVSVCKLQPAYGYHTTTAKSQHNPNTHRTRAIQPMK